MSIKFSSSVILVKDIKTTRKFYEEILEQNVEIDHGACVGFKGGLSIWEADYAYNLIYKKKFDEEINKSEKEFELYFESTELESINEKLINQNIEFVNEMFEQPWGQRVIRIYDPNRFIVEIGEPMSVVIQRYLDSGLTEEETSVKTFMPAEIIKKIKNSNKVNFNL